ncbi:MAG: DHH family phosphoesterase [Acutalibacteraceae bacterium]
MISASAAASFLERSDKFVILTHASPDGDTLGSAYALADALCALNKRVFVVCPDKIPEKFGYLIKEYEAFEPETVVAVDIADEKLLGSLYDRYSGRAALCIDHHSSNTKYAEMLYLEADAAAACECIYNVINELGTKITPYMASCLYTGIATDTGCFKFSNTTPRSHRYAAELIEKGADYGEINRVMFEVKSRGRIAMERKVLENIEFYYGGRCAVITVTRDMIKETGCPLGDLDGVTAMSRQIEGVQIGVTIKEKPDGKYKVSLRTFEPYNAADICAVFGGGGHIRAAGCEFSCDIESAKRQLLSAIGEVLR